MIGERPQTDRGESDVETTLDEQFGMLGDEHRRRVLFSLLDDAGGPPGSRPLEAVPDGTIETVALEMRHVHLPKLDAAGYVDWDRETGAIRRGCQFHEIRPLLELLADNADRLPLAYA